VADLVREAEAIATKGQREIVLTGINVGDFGRTTGESFIDLLRALDAVEGIDRYRISSIEPNLLTDEVIAFTAGSDKFQPHFHVPLQSGCDRILALMRRRYNTARFAERIGAVRAQIPGVFFGIDVIVGFPGETDEDIAAIAELANDIAATYFELPKEERQGRPEITASTSFFVPKPFTPFQWAPMGTAEYFDEKRRFLTGKVREQINQRSIRYICHDAVTSELEGIFARGDRKLSDVIEKAYKKGCIFDAWTDYFRPDVWNELLDELSVDRDFYNYRERNEDEIFPWDFIDIGVSKQFLRREYENAKQGKVTPNCKQKCSGCGAASFHAGICMMDRKASGGSAQ